MTTSVEAPPRNLYDVGQWLCRENPHLMQLCYAIGAVDSAGKVDTQRVRDSVISFDAFHRDRLDFNRKNGLKPRDETPESMSITLGPQPSEAAARMLCMLPGNIAELRLLATTAPMLYGWPNVEWCVDSMLLVGAGSEKLLRDWLAAMTRYVNGGQ